MTELDGSCGRTIDDKRSVAGKAPRVKRTAVVEQPAVLLRPVCQHDEMW